MASRLVINVSAQFTRPLFDEADGWHAQAAELRGEAAALTDDPARRSALEADAGECDRKAARIEESAVALLAAEGITGANAFAQKTVELSAKDVVALIGGR